MIKGVSKWIENETTKQKIGFLSMKLGTLGANILGILLEVKDAIRDNEGTINTK